MSGLRHALERLNAALRPDSPARLGRVRNKMLVEVSDLEELLRDHHALDAAARAAHVRDVPQAYPPRNEMLARGASDPGMYAGYKGERSMGGWIADAILAVERRVARDDLVREFLDFARYLANEPANPDGEQREVSVRMIRAVGAALAGPPPAVVALRDLIDMVDRLDRHPSRGGGVLPMDKAKVMHAAREAAQ